MITAIGSKCVIETARLVLVGEFDEEHAFAEADIHTQGRADKEAELIILRVLGERDEDVVAAVGSEIRGHLGSKEVHFDVREDRDSHCGFIVRVVLLVTNVFRFFEAHIDIIHTDTSAQTDDLVEAVGCNKVGSKREVLLVIDTFVARETDLGFKTLDFPFFLLREDGGTNEHKAQHKKQSFHSEKEIKIKPLFYKSDTKVEVWSAKMLHLKGKNEKSAGIPAQTEHYNSDLNAGKRRKSDFSHFDEVRVFGNDFICRQSILYLDNSILII